MVDVSRNNVMGGESENARYRQPRPDRDVRGAVIRWRRDTSRGVFEHPA